MDIVTLIIQLGSGLLGGIAAGSVMRTLNLGALGNAVAGLVGGGVGSQVLNSLVGASSAAIVTTASGEPDISAVIAQVAGGGIGGGIMVIVVGVLKQLFQPEPFRS